MVALALNEKPLVQSVINPPIPLDYVAVRSLRSNQAARQGGVDKREVGLISSLVRFAVC